MVVSTLLAASLLTQGKVALSVSVSFKPEKDGKSGSGVVTVTIPEGWHAYQNPPKSEYDTPLSVSTKTKGFKLSDVKYPVGQPLESAGNEALVYEGKVEVPFKATLGKELKAKKGKFEVTFDVGYQICSGSTCLPPTSVQGKLSWAAK